jgi:hypothetical protein
MASQDTCRSSSAFSRVSERRRANNTRYMTILVHYRLLRNNLLNGTDGERNRIGKFQGGKELSESLRIVRADSWPMTPVGIWQIS